MKRHETSIFVQRGQFLGWNVRCALQAFIVALLQATQMLRKILT